jgi:hypothetical protein
MADPAAGASADGEHPACQQIMARQPGYPMADQVTYDSYPVTQQTHATMNNQLKIYLNLNAASIFTAIRRTRKSAPCVC